MVHWAVTGKLWFHQKYKADMSTAPRAFCRTNFFLSLAEKILAYRKTTLTNVLVVAKTTQKQIFIKIQLF